MGKFKISVIDAMPDYKKHKTDLVDKNGKELFLGDTVLNRSEKMLVGYRYGIYCLLPFSSSCYIKPSSGSDLELLNEFTAATHQYLIIGYTDEPIYEKLKHLLN